MFVYLISQARIGDIYNVFVLQLFVLNVHSDMHTSCKSRSDLLMSQCRYSINVATITASSNGGTVKDFSLSCAIFSNLWIIFESFQTVGWFINIILREAFFINFISKLMEDEVLVILLRHYCILVILPSSVQTLLSIHIPYHHHYFISWLYIWHNLGKW